MWGDVYVHAICHRAREDVAADYRNRADTVETAVVCIRCTSTIQELHHRDNLAGFRPAALLLTRVISRPAPTRITLDLGYKAVASDPPAGKRCVLLNVPDFKLVGQNPLIDSKFNIPRGMNGGPGMGRGGPGMAGGMGPGGPQGMGPPGMNGDGSPPPTLRAARTRRSARSQPPRTQDCPYHSS